MDDITNWLRQRLGSVLPYLGLVDTQKEPDCLPLGRKDILVIRRCGWNSCNSVMLTPDWSREWDGGGRLGGGIVSFWASTGRWSVFKYEIVADKVKIERKTDECMGGIWGSNCNEECMASLSLRIQLLWSLWPSLPPKQYLWLTPFLSSRLICPMAKWTSTHDILGTGHLTGQVLKSQSLLWLCSLS